MRTRRAPIGTPALASKTPPQFSEHHFHIPVMGTGFTNTTPLEAAPLGISSVVALADDSLLEQQRKVLSREFGLDYQPIGYREPDRRARRTQAFLDVLHDEVERRVAALRTAPFEKGSPIHRYFELLPDGALRTRWENLARITDPAKRQALEAELRQGIIPGQIDVNIMTKLDNAINPDGTPRPPGQSDAVASLRGFAASRLRSSVVLSAGMNPRLFAAAAALDCFFVDDHGVSDKRLCLKVSDYRSAQIQGTLLAKKGLWTSEFRIESGLNCGGHAFPTDGLLLGPILDEFIENREALRDKLFTTLSTALRALGRPVPTEPPPIRLTVQGGVGTAAEQRLLLERYKVDAVGWGSAFLFCPEVISIDDVTLERLLHARPEDIELSESSPLGVPFWSLRTSLGEERKRAAVTAGQSGSTCPLGILVFNTEFTETPICTASRNYHSRLAKSLETASPELRHLRLREAEGKACLCRDLGGAAKLRWNIDKDATPLLCPGPNARYFRRAVGFDEMVGHIYGRGNVLPEEATRAHVFINELELYLDFLEKRLTDTTTSAPREGWTTRYSRGLGEGITHLRALSDAGWVHDSPGFLEALAALEARLEEILDRSAYARAR